MRAVIHNLHGVVALCHARAYPVVGGPINSIGFQPKTEENMHEPE
jgi:hypothetical protein